MNNHTPFVGARGVKELGNECNGDITPMVRGRRDILVSLRTATTSEKSMLERDLVFLHSYEVEGLPELPGSEKFDVPVAHGNDDCKK
jgi:hypothetical protein